MKKAALLSIASISLLFAGCGEQESKTNIADTIYTNGKIYTVDKAKPWVEAVAIKEGRFVEVGSKEQVEAFRGSETKVIDLGGSFAMPGIADSHIHPGLLMPKRAYCALPGTFHSPNEEQIIAELKSCIENYPAEKSWFIAQGYTTPAMSEKTLTREYLDTLIPDRPAWIEDETGHNAWFNTKALELVGITKDFKDTPEEFFSRTEDGDIAGVAFEGAMNPFLDKLPPFDTKILKDGFMSLLNEATSLGITNIGDAYVFENDLQAWQELKQEGKLQQHVSLYLKGNLGTNELTPVSELIAIWNKYDLPGIKGVKMGMGGAIESASEALVDGYADPKNVSRPIVEKEMFADYVQQLDDAGFQLKIHAIGDGTVRATIDGYETVINKRGNNDLRHHIDHCSLIHPDDYERLAKLDISCTIWPQLNAPVAYNIEGIKPMLKPETWKRMYANRDAWDGGVKLVNHSDAPAAVLWPWWGMEATVTRKVPGKKDSDAMGISQALTVAEVIEAYTINAAWSLHNDKETGSIETGKWADMIILNHNLLEVDPSELHKTKVSSTIFKGNEVYNGK